MQNKTESFARLLRIMDELREQCPWDKKQTIESLRILTIEETYELADAIDAKDMTALKEEIGDLMLHLVFYAKIASETKQFDIADVLNTVCDKLIARHPHIYADVKVNGEEEVKQNWEKLKMKEGRTSMLQGVPQSLPALVKAYRMQEKAKQVGFEWEHIEQVKKKVEEEWAELNEEIGGDNKEKIEEEFGDLLFAMVNYSRFLKVDPEAALEKCNIKFKKRFQYIEEQAQKINKPLTEMTLEEMDGYWNEAKRMLKSNNNRQ
jgi:XTP/dITP diphosphohydrolase